MLRHSVVSAFDPGRRALLRRGLLTAGALAVPGVLAACGDDGDEPAATQTAEGSVDALLAGRREAGARADLAVIQSGEDYVAGPANYLAFGLARPGRELILEGTARFWLAASSDPARPTRITDPVEASWHAYARPDGPPPLPQGINAATVTFDEAGFWTAVVEVETSGASWVGTAALEVKPLGATSTRTPGEEAISSETPTLEDPRGVDPICTREPPCPMHETTLAGALEAGKPTAFIVATPAFCTSRTCGPNLEELIAVREEVGDRAAFIHAEVYKDADPETVSRQLTSPTFQEWGFQSEPWLFLVRPDGVIDARFEGPVTASVIRPALETLVG